MAEAKVTLAHKKNFRDAEAKKPALLAKIKAASGVDYTFDLEPKFDDFVIGLIKAGSGYHERVGEGLFNDDGYLAHIAQLNICSFETACKDDMIKEAIVEATPNKKLILALSNDDVPSEKCVAFKDGNMYFYITPKKFYLWLSSIANFDVTKIL